MLLWEHLSLATQPVHICSWAPESFRRHFESTPTPFLHRSLFFIIRRINVISLYNVDKYTYDHFLTWGRVRRYVATDCKCLCSKLRNIFFSSKINSLGNCKGNSPWSFMVVFLQNCFISCQPLGETGAWNGLPWSQEDLWNEMKKSWQSSRLDKT